MTAGMKLLVIAPWGRDIGFRLAGARVEIAPDEDSLNAGLAEAIKGGKTAVIALPESMRDWISPDTQRLLGQGIFPLLSFYRFPDEWPAAADAGEEVAELARRAIGYRLRIKL